MNEIENLIHHRVRQMYDRFPYPSYPLFLPLKWWEAYLTSSSFSRAVTSREPLTSIIEPRKILIIGSGDTLPYIIDKLEPSSHRITACDFSYHTIRRAKLRLWLSRRPIQWIHNDLQLLNASCIGEFDHIDCYGVLHHLANPRQGLIEISRLLREGGTLRLMVYNSQARDWIYNIQKIFQIFDLKETIPSDISLAKLFLKKTAHSFPILNRHLSGVGQTIYQHQSRMVDTFFHKRECRLSYSDWLEVIESSGFTVSGIFDRYGELDDLRNPLWQAPSFGEMLARIRDGRFENNFEWYLVKGNHKNRPSRSYSNLDGNKDMMRPWQGPWRAFTKAPPRIWSEFTETSRISGLILRRLWIAHLKRVYMQRQTIVDQHLLKLPTSSIQRLSRIGAFFPDQLQSVDLKQLALAPIHNSMEAPEFGKYVDANLSPIKDIIHLILSKKNRPMSMTELILKRLNQAQTHPMKST